MREEISQVAEMFPYAELAAKFRPDALSRVDTAVIRNEALQRIWAEGGTGRRPSGAEPPPPWL